MIIVSHKLFLRTLGGEQEISIDIHQPQPRPPVWACRYDVDWPEGMRTMEAVGFDALQALTLALEMIGAEIYTSTYHAEGRLRAYESDSGYGFPVPSTLRDRLVGVDAI